jgi:hypothetical protein
MRRSALRSLGFVPRKRRQAHRSLTQTPADDAWLFVIAGLDPAIHRLRKRMDARVKPAHDERRDAWLFEIVSAQKNPPHPEERRSRVSKDGQRHGPAWFETHRCAMLLTMRREPWLFEN